MSIDLVVRMDTSGVVTSADTAATSVAKLEDGTERVRDAMGRFAKTTDDVGTSAAKTAGTIDDLKELCSQLEHETVLIGKSAADAAEALAGAGATGAAGTNLQLEVLERIRGPMRDYIANVNALDTLMAQAKISSAEYDTELERLNKQFGQMQGPISQIAEREAAAVERIRGPMQRYQDEMATLKRVLDQGRITIEEYDAEVDKLNRRLGINQPQGPISQIAEREAAALQRIRGPMQQYEQEVATLERLMSQGKITADEYAAELEKQAKKAGVFHGPIQQPGAAQLPIVANEGPTTAQQAAQGALGAVAGQLGPAGGLINSIGSGAAASAAAVVGLVVAITRLSDDYIVLSNAAQKLTAAGGSVDETLREQYDLSLKLHAGLSETMSLYDAVRDGTDELNLSQAQQIKLTQEIGDAVIASGGSIEKAEGLMRRLTFAFASGSISGRDLKSVMKEFPDIGAAFVETMGHSRKELIDMANKGQISSEMLIASFDKMGKEMEEKVGKKLETVGQKWDHLKDKLSLDMGGIASGQVSAVITAVDTGIDKFKDLAAAIADAYANPAEKAFIENQGKIIRGYLAQMEALKQLSGEEDRNAKTAQLAAAAGKLGIDFGAFNEAEANKQAEFRIKQRQAGIEIADAFADAHGKSTLFGAKLAEINEKRDAEKIAEDVKRLDLEMNGVNEAMDKNFKKWTDLNDQIELARKVVARFKQDTPAGVPIMQDQRDAERRLRDLQTQRDLGEYGSSVTQDATRKAQAKDSIEDYTRALQKGLITQEAFRHEYDKSMTTMNDGRLPETIKFWEEFHLPVQQFHRDMSALNSLLASGGATLAQYTLKVHELEDAFDKTGVLKMIRENDEAFARAARGPVRTQASDFAAEQARVGQEKRQDLIGEPAIEAARAYEQKLADITAVAQRFNLSQRAVTALQLEARDAFDSSTSALDKIIVKVAGYQDALSKLTTRRDSGELSGEQFQAGVSALDRETKLVEQFEMPAAIYKRALEDIAGAQIDVGLSTERARVLQLKAKDAYNQATEALEATKGPLGVYTATLKKLSDQLHDGQINSDKYNESIAKAREAYLQATGASKTFSGGMELAWLKAKADAENFGATVAGQVVGDVDKLNAAIITAANGGEVAWGQMVDAMIEDLGRLLIKQLEVLAITQLINAFAPGAGTAATASGATGAGVDAANAITGPVTSPSQVARAYTQPSVASAGQTTQAAAGAPAPSIVIVNQMSDSAVIPVLASRAGQRVIANQQRRMRGMRG